ncbi:MAG: SpoIID/LytB domain-containing protein [Synechococcaceae cyanobacterium]|nr:SpoIID/LytB domain-containing protein [Synechococcaceae cyanobacterium]
MPIPSPRTAVAALRRRLPLLILPTSLLVLGGAASSQAFLPREDSPQQPTNQDVLIRVLLQQDALLQVGAGSGPLQISDARGRRLHALAPGDELHLEAGGSGLILERRGANAATLATGLREVWIGPSSQASADAVLLLGGKPFRGRMQVRLNSGQLQAINHVPLELYLMSVVGSEMPASWPQAALQAQAVAARTYALARRRPREPFDLRATVASQVYRGVAGETKSTRAAVASTSGQVLLYNNAPIEAVFHSSSSSGRTESSGELWNQQLPYLVSVPDFDNASPVHSWRARFEPADLRRIFPETGGLQRLEVLNQSNSGRIRRVRIVGPLGSLQLTGAELRQRLGLRSTMVQLELIGGQSQPTTPAAVPTGTVDRAPVIQAAAQPQGASTGSPVALPDSASGAWGSPPPSLPPVPMSTTMATVAQPLPRRDPPALMVAGQGYGHGVGMSQWGAYGMALQGRTYGEILQHYYRGVELKPFRASSF